MKAKVLKTIKINNSQHKITKKCQKSNWKSCVYVDWISEFHIVNSLISQNCLITKNATKCQYNFMICDTLKAYWFSQRGYFFHKYPYKALKRESLPLLLYKNSENNRNP